MSDLVLSAPGVFSGLYSLISTAATAYGSTAFAFALTQDEPASYVILTAIKNHRMTPAAMPYVMNEAYDIEGIATVFSGSATPDDATVTLDVMKQTYALFQAAVMTPFVSNRSSSPLFGTTGPSPWQVLPGPADYVGSPGMVGGGAAGWAGSVNFSFHFETRLLPA